MNRFKIAGLFFLLTFSVYGKDTTSVGFKRFALSIHASPDYCYRTLVNNDGSESSNSVITARESTEIPKMGYTAGLGLLFNIKKKFALELGVAYSNKGYQTKALELYFVSPTGVPDPAIPVSFKERYHFSCIDLPLTAQVKLGEKKLSFIGSVGIAANIILFERVETFKEFADGSVERKKGPSNFIYNPLNFSGLVGIGANLKLGKNANLRLLPTYRYGFTRIISAPVSGKLWNAGLDVGFYIDL